MAPAPARTYRGPLMLPALVACALTLAPFLAGYTLGIPLRAPRRRAVVWLRRMRVVVAAAVPAAAFLLVPVFESFASWDLLLAALLLGAGLLCGAAVPRRRPLVRVALGLLVAALPLAVVEAGARWWLPPPQEFPDVGLARFPWQFSSRIDPDRCPALYPDAALRNAGDPFTFAARTREPDARPQRVVHVGDSLVAGTGVALEGTFPAQLARLQPRVAHVNAGFPGTGNDYHLLIVRRWLARVRADLVVQYVFANDPDENDRRSACCGDEPLLRDGAFEASCEGPRAPTGALSLLRRAPPPYVLRVATGFSAAARHAAVAIARAANFDHGGLEPALDHATVLRRRARMVALLEESHREIVARGARHALVYLPDRAALEQGGWVAKREEEMRAAVAAAALQMGAASIDAAEFFHDALRAKRFDALFRPHGDVHFSAEGHRAFAEWLAPRLAPLLPSAPALAPAPAAAAPR